MARVQLRRDTAAAWTAANPVLGIGEPAYETDTKRRKTGDGATAWTALAYDGADKANVSALAAKADAAAVSDALAAKADASALASKADAAATTAALASKLTDPGTVSLGAGSTTITHAAHANRVGNVNQPASTTAVFGNAAASGAVAGDSVYIRNDGAGTLTAGGAITAPTGYTLVAPTGCVLSADYSAVADAWFSTTVSQVAGSAGAAVPTVTLAVQDAAPSAVEFNFSTPMYRGSIPAAAALTATKNGSAWGVNNFAWASATKAIATMASPMAQGDTALVTFAEGTGPRFLTLATNMPLPSFSAMPVATNFAATISVLYPKQNDQTYFAPDWGTNSSADGPPSFYTMGVVGTLAGAGYLQMTVGAGAGGTFGLGTSAKFLNSAGGNCETSFNWNGGGFTVSQASGSASVIGATLTDGAFLRLNRDQSNIVTIQTSTDSGTTFQTVYTFTAPLTGTANGYIGSGYDHNLHVRRPVQFGFTPAVAA